MVGRALDQLGHIQTLADVLRYLGAGHVFVAQLVEELVVHLVEVEAHFFEDRLRVRVVDRMLAALDHVAVQLGGVGHVEVAHDHEALRRPVAPAHIGMARCLPKRTRRAVAQMAHEHLAAELEVLLDHLGVVRVEVVLLAQAVEVLLRVEEDFLQRIALHRALAETGRAHPAACAACSSRCPRRPGRDSAPSS